MNRSDVDLQCLNESFKNKKKIQFYKQKVFKDFSKADIVEYNDKISTKKLNHYIENLTASAIVLISKNKEHGALCLGGGLKMQKTAN